MKWSVHKNRCRYNYRCCPEVWLATPPGEDGWFSYEFNTWGDAMAFANEKASPDERSSPVTDHPLGFLLD